MPLGVTLYRIKDLADVPDDATVGVEARVEMIKEVDTTGKTYNQTLVTLKDRTGSLTLCIWKKASEIANQYVEGGLVCVTGKKEMYDSKPRIKPTNVVGIEPTPENEARILFPPRGITEENEKLFLNAIERAFADARYKRYAQVAFGIGPVPAGVSEAEYRSRYTRIKKAWASLNHHDSYPGGLFNHLVGLIRLWANMRAQYNTAAGRTETGSTMNWDYILLMIFLHDYGKQFDYEISADEKTAKFMPGRKLNHVVEGLTHVAFIDREVEPELRLSFVELEEFKFGILTHHQFYDKNINYFDINSKNDKEKPEDKVFRSMDIIDATNVDMLIVE